ncbi:MAG: hypothetical protein ACETVO_06930 [bacterium]
MEYRCDLCGKKIVRNRYLLRIASYAAYDGLEIGLLDLTRDFAKEIKDLLRKIEKKRGKKLEKDICVGFEFVLCKKCRDNYLSDPLGKKRFESSTKRISKKRNP